LPSEPSRDAAVVRAGAAPACAEAECGVPALGRRAGGNLSVAGVGGTMDGQALPIDIGALLDQLRGGQGGCVNTLGWPFSSLNVSAGDQQ